MTGAELGPDLALLELLGVLDDVLQLAVHQLLLEGCQLSLLLLILLGCQVPVGQQLHRHPVLVGQQILLYQGPKHVLPRRYAPLQHNQLCQAPSEVSIQNCSHHQYDLV